MIRNVLVTCGGGFQGLAILQGLRRIGSIRVVVADSSADNVGSYFASSFRRAPPVSDVAGYRDFITSTIAAENIDLVIPATDLDLIMLASERAKFAASGTAIAVSDAPLLAKLFDKRKAYQFSAEAGVNIFEEVTLDPSRPLKFPVIAKPLRGFGSKGQHVLLANTFPSEAPIGIERSTHIWQPYVERCTEYSVDFAIDVNGRVSPLAARERTANFGGFSVLGKTVTEHRSLQEQAERLAQHLARNGGCGGFNIQFLDYNGKPTLIDINARFGTSSSLALEMGINLQAWLVGERVEDLKRDVRLIRYITQTHAPLRAKQLAGVVFDLDDTLIDQKSWILDKLRELHQLFGSSLPPKAEFLACAMQILEEGNRARLIDDLIEQFGLPASMREGLITAYREIIPQEIVVYPDVVRVIAELRRRGVRIGLLSDNPAASQRQKLERLQPTLNSSAKFDAIILTDEIAAPKPDARAYEAVAAALDLPCNSIAMVGDNFFRDSLGALRAGYSAAFHLQRAGTFFNFNSQTLADIPNADQVNWIESLDELLWHLPS